MNRLSTLLGIILGVVGVFGAQILDHGSPASLINPSALLLIFLGTLGATLASTGMDQMSQLPKWLRQALNPRLTDIQQEREFLVELAKKARRAGLLQLEQDAEAMDNPYLRRGIDNAISGMEPEIIEAQMAAESDSLYAHDALASQFFETAGGFSPTMGIIGTVVGLISVLSNVSDVARLAASIATAFTATLWGILLANLVWLPIGLRLKRLAHEARLVREVQAAAVVAIARGDSSRQLERQLASMLAGQEAAKKPPRAAKEAADQSAANPAAQQTEPS
jgi:chemotaxis protein MotA